MSSLLIFCCAYFFHFSKEPPPNLLLSHENTPDQSQQDHDQPIPKTSTDIESSSKDICNTLFKNR